MWDTQMYSQFLDLRTRPARDLLSVIPNTFQPNIVYDLGCGLGNSTGLLKQRWPNAQIIGLDSSDAMLQEAKTRYPGIEFIKEDIANFETSKKIDCLFANASLQWLDQHEIIIPKLCRFLNSDGLLAIQMPNNFHAPAHQIPIQLLQNTPDWQRYLKNLRYSELTEPLYKLSWYYDLLVDSGVRFVEMWETEYFHEMSTYYDIFNWVKGTGLRPILSVMDDKTQAQFASQYIEAISKKYPQQANKKILFSFKRIFIIAIK